MGSLKENEKRERVVSTYLGWRSGLTFLEVNKKNPLYGTFKKSIGLDLKITAQQHYFQSLSSAFFFRLFFFFATNVVDSSSELFSEESTSP